jgi:pimeloyl-ACP methyl ester carboxylesterase
MQQGSHKTFNLAVQKVKLNAFIQGEGEAILCLSGFGCDHYNYLELMPHLSKSFKMVMLDNRGMGLSEHTHQNYTIKDLALDALEVMHVAGFKRFHVIGISMGGFIAQVLNEVSPKSILSLTLMCTTGTDKDFSSIPILDNQKLEKFYHDKPLESIPLAVAFTTHLETDQSRIAKIITTRLKHHEKLDQVLLQRDAVALFFKNQVIDYNKFKMPCLILTGKDDRFVNPINSEILAKKISGSKLVKIDKTDHFFFMEKPCVVASHINLFLKEL